MTNAKYHRITIYLNDEKENVTQEKIDIEETNLNDANNKFQRLATDRLHQINKSYSVHSVLMEQNGFLVVRYNDGKQFIVDVLFLTFVADKKDLVDEILSIVGEALKQ